VGVNGRAEAGKAAPQLDTGPATFISPIAVALIAILTALTTAVTMTLAVPFPPTRGFFNLGDSMVFFSALTFGWRAGAICGGIGSAAADVLLGYGYFAPITLISKGTEGLVAGALGKIKAGKTWMKVFGIAAGGACMVTGYFVGETLYYGIGPALAEIPVNVVQAAVGGSIGLALSYFVLLIIKEFPRIPARL
jgi:uncharacterized membrane protein